jgi:hypothetical protein
VKKMPYGDGTGPLGYGPRSGRHAGFCGGYSVPGFMNNVVPRRGLGRGNGFYWGLRNYDPYSNNRYSIPTSNVAALTNEDQKKILEEELKDLEAQKQAIENRLKELK